MSNKGDKYKKDSGHSQYGATCEFVHPFDKRQLLNVERPKREIHQIRPIILCDKGVRPGSADRGSLLHLGSTKGSSKGRSGSHDRKGGKGKIG
eukprot:878767-Amphidinium_carterae.1